MRFCPGSFPVRKACLLFLKRWRFVRFDLDSECVASSLPQSTFTCALRGLENESDIIKDDNVPHAASTIFKAMRELDLKGCIGLCISCWFSFIVSISVLCTLLFIYIVNKVFFL